MCKLFLFNISVFHVNRIVSPRRFFFGVEVLSSTLDLVPRNKKYTLSCDTIKVENRFYDIYPEVTMYGGLHFAYFLRIILIVDLYMPKYII